MAGEWLEVTLGDLCDFRAGSGFKLQYQGSTTGDYPFIKVSDMNLPANGIRIRESNNWVDQRIARKIKARPLPTGTIVFAKIGEALKRNRLRMIVRPTIVDNNMMGAIPNTDIVDPGFLFYGMHQFDFGRVASGTALPYLTVSTLTELLLSLPPFVEQRAIADVLGALDDKIEQNQQTAWALERLTWATFRAWFVDFEPVKAKAAGADSFHSMPQHVFDSLPTRIVDSEIGPVPEGWEVVGIGDVVTVKGGGTPSTKTPDYWDGGEHCWATPRDMSRLRHPVLLDTERRITDAGVDHISSGLLPVGTVLMSSRAPVGYLAIAGVPTAINQGFIAMVCDGPLPPIFVLNWAFSQMETIKARASGTTFPEISKKNFRPLTVVRPTDDVIAAYQQANELLFDLLTVCVKENVRLAEMRDYLLPQLLSGQIRVEVADG